MVNYTIIFLVIKKRKILLSGFKRDHLKISISIWNITKIFLRRFDSFKISENTRIILCVIVCKIVQAYTFYFFMPIVWVTPSEFLFILTSLMHNNDSLKQRKNIVLLMMDGTCAYMTENKTPQRQSVFNVILSKRLNNVSPVCCCSSKSMLQVYVIEYIYAYKTTDKSVRHFGDTHILPLSSYLFKLLQLA